MIRLRVVAGSEEERRRIDALIDECGLTRLPGPPWDAIVTSFPTSLEHAEAPIVLLVEDFTGEVAMFAQRNVARTVLFRHGPAVLREALLAARRQEATRALVYLSVSDVIFNIKVERDRFRFVRINQAFTRATGLTEEQVVGKLVDDVIPEPSLSLVLHHYREAIRERRTVRWEEKTEYPTGTKYGEVSVTPIVDADGRATHLVGTVVDVTDGHRSRALGAAERRALEMIAGGASIDVTLEAYVRAVEDVVRPARAAVHLVSNDGHHLRAGAAPSLPEIVNAAVIREPISTSASPWGAAVALGKPQFVADLTTDPRWSQLRMLADVDVYAIWVMPILASDSHVLGVFTLSYREPRMPNEEELALFERVIHVAGIAIQRNELDEQLRELSGRLEAAREEERTGIAREIHDQLGQALTVLKMDVAWIARRAGSDGGIAKDALLGKVTDLLAQADHLIDEVRRISTELRPGILDDIGLVAALVWQAQAFERRTDIACDVESTLPETVRLSREVETAAFRVAQEALTNVARHAGASMVQIRVDRTPQELTLEVSDNGRGISDDAMRAPRSLGLLGIRERARRLGGTATIARREPSGTTVTLRLPL